jgi:hypothetical protein
VAGGDGTAWFDSFELKKISKNRENTNR